MFLNRIFKKKENKSEKVTEPASSDIQARFLFVSDLTIELNNVIMFGAFIS